MTAVHAVLLIPEEGDPHKLLEEGPCGARPPVVQVCNICGRWHAEEASDVCIDSSPWDTDQQALVLAWGGEVVAEGVMRVKRCAELLEQWCEMVLADDNAPERTVIQEGTLVLLDADGREISA